MRHARCLMLLIPWRVCWQQVKQVQRNTDEQRGTCSQHTRAASGNYIDPISYKSLLAQKRVSCEAKGVIRLSVGATLHRTMTQVTWK